MYAFVILYLWIKTVGPWQCPACEDPGERREWVYSNRKFCGNKHSSPMTVANNMAVDRMDVQNYWNIE